MRYIFGMIGLLACLATGCGNRDGGEVAPSVETPQPSPSEVAPESSDAGAQPPIAPARGDAAPEPVAPVSREAVCAQAARCCEAAFTTPGLPTIYAERREQACATIAEIPDVAGCRMAMESWRRMVTSAPDGVAPPACSER